jgi:hypothetical protein
MLQNKYSHSQTKTVCVPSSDFNKMYELYDPCTIMFFFRNKHIMIDLGTGNNNKINWAMEDKQVRGLKCNWIQTRRRLTIQCLNFRLGLRSVFTNNDYVSLCVAQCHATKLEPIPFVCHAALYNAARQNFIVRENKHVLPVMNLSQMDVVRLVRLLTMQ